MASITTAAVRSLRQLIMAGKRKDRLGTGRKGNEIKEEGREGRERGGRDGLGPTSNLG